MIKEELLQIVKEAPLPKHIAVIMDGNGRWAQAKGQGRFMGHRAGAAALRRVVEGARTIGIEYLTVFAFSTENWSRPKDEVSLLMTLLSDYLDKETDNLLEQDIKLQFIGDYKKLNALLVKKIEQSMKKTEKCEHTVLTIAMNYGGRQDICRAARNLAQKVQTGEITPEQIDETLFQKALYTGNMPEVDLLIRTSGEKRISNFMLWQSAYAELVISDIFWPDFDENDLMNTIIEFQHRQRRFGNVK